MLSVLPSLKRIAPETFPLPENDAFAAGRSHPALGAAKRATDVTVSLILLLVLSPLLLVTALLVLAVLGWPVLFTQQRPGLGGRPFRLIKFRSMPNGWERSGACCAQPASMSCRSWSTCCAAT